jgi:hypothetical protein
MRLANNKEAVFSAWSVQSGYKEEFSGSRSVKGVEFRDASPSRYDLWSRGTELISQLQNNCKKGIRLLKGDFMCDLK